MLFDQIEEDVEPLLRRQASVKLIVGRLGVFKASEHLNDPFHVFDFTIRRGLAGGVATAMLPAC